MIVRPDGSDPHVISEETWIAYTWSADSRRVYGLREADRPRHLVLGAIDIETRRERVVNPELGVIPPAFQAIRGLERIGSDALVTSIARSRSDIWLAEGPRLFLGQRRLLDRLWRAAPKPPIEAFLQGLVSISGGIHLSTLRPPSRDGSGGMSCEEP